MKKVSSFVLEKSSSCSSSSPLLPEAGSSSSFSAANESVTAATAQCGKRKRGPYHHYDTKIRAKIAKYACENGNKSTVGEFSSQLGHAISETTVRNFKRA